MHKDSATAAGCELAIQLAAAKVALRKERREVVRLQAEVLRLRRQIRKSTQEMRTK